MAVYDYKVLVRAPLSKEILEKLNNEFSEVIYDPWNTTGERYYEDEMAKVLQELKPDILITELDKVTEKVLSSYEGLKLIGDCRSNPANIDVEACTKHNVPIVCTPGRNKTAVAEMVIGGILAFYRNVVPSHDWMMNGEWVEGTTPYFTWMGHELSRKKVGFVGFGAVGQATAKMMCGFDCDFYYYDPYVKMDDPQYKKMELEEIFETCDIISIHLPVLDSTRNIIDQHLFDLMKKDALFVNSARSAVVDQDAMINTLKNKKILGAVFDVFPTEPMDAKEVAKYDLDNVLITPHIYGSTFEVTDHQAEIVYDNIVNYLNNKNLKKIVYNKEVL